ncbi:MAG: hypothetical protein ACETWR_08385 [Anaerolineae bacterium]
MKRATFYLVLVVAVLAVLLLAGCAGKQSEGERPSVSTAQPSPPTMETGQPSTSGWDLSSRRNDAGRVVIDVQPQKLDDDQETWEFAVALNTHSVNLDFDMTEVSALRCDQDQEYTPTVWEGPGPGGHHRSGVLKFAALDHSTSFVEIVIRDVAEVPERVFRWDLPSRAQSSPGGSMAQSSPTAEDGPAHLGLSAEEFNFGDVPMSMGVVSAVETIINSGSGTLRIEGVEPT